MFFADGSYNFNKREEKEYHHDYAYMGGFLGEEEVEKELKRKKQIGKLTMDVVLPPMKNPKHRK